jgi:hypothetical protein
LGHKGRRNSDFVIFKAAINILETVREVTAACTYVMERSKMREGQDHPSQQFRQQNSFPCPLREGIQGE